MNWTKISAIAEITSSAAILVTLIYLTIQTQQNTEAIQANGRQASSEMIQQLLHSQMENPAPWTRLHETEYTDEEKVYFNAWLVAFFELRQTDWFNYQNGTLDEAAWIATAESVEQVLSTPNFRAWWESFAAEVFHPEFRAQIDEILIDSPTRSENNILRTFE